MMTSSVTSLRQSPSVRQRCDRQNSIGPLTIAVGGPTNTTISTCGRFGESLLLGLFGIDGRSGESLLLGLLGIDMTPRSVR